jgi:hypothetical protein
VEVRASGGRAVTLRIPRHEPRGGLIRRACGPPQLFGGVLGALLLRAVLGGAETGLGMPTLAHDLALGATTLTITPWAGYDRR